MICPDKGQKINEIVAWRSEGDRYMDRVLFLGMAKQMMSAIPDDVYFPYHIFEAELCKLM
jgi:hypothetical protein